MKTILVLSPHLDDAVLSLGGMMAQKVSSGQSVVVYNLFCAPYHGPLSPAAQRLHEGWGDPEDLAGLRLQEDRQALEVIGAQQIIGDARDSDLPAKRAGYLAVHQHGRYPGRAQPGRQRTGEHILQ